MPIAPPIDSSPVRHECKFVVPLPSLPRVKAMLDHHCARDPAFHSNIIRSLYFDTHGMDLLRQKQESELLKRKVRIRWYVDAATGEVLPRAFLEVKSKTGARGEKQRMELTVSAAEFDRAPGAAVGMLSDEETPHLAGLEPAGVIQYHRRRYIEMGQGYRVALDDDIRATWLNRDLLRHRRELRPQVAVLEVKGAGARALPPSLSMLHRWGVRKTAFSKYMACLDDAFSMETDPR